MELVSVITPTYNAAEFVEETLESVLAQTYPRIEHVLVDDGSTDGTAERLTAYAQRHPDRIRVLRRDDRAGPCRRRNEAIDAAAGTLLAWLDHDDLWHPEKTARQVESLARRPRAAFAFSQYEEFDHATGRTLVRSSLDAEGATLPELFARGCFVASSTVLFRRAALATRQLRLREADFSFGDDYFLWLSLLLDWESVCVDEVLARLRRRPASESARLGRRNTYPASVALLEEFVETFPDAAAKLGRFRRAGIARHWAAAAEYELARARNGRAAVYALRATAHDPRGALRFARRAARRRAGRLRR
jgi:glycosyltransferase involved in cell wall biosynthesis